LIFFLMYLSMCPQVKGQWRQPDRCGGCGNHASFLNNPQVGCRWLCGNLCLFLTNLPTGTRLKNPIERMSNFSSRHYVINVDGIKTNTGTVIGSIDSVFNDFSPVKFSDNTLLFVMCKNTWHFDTLQYGCQTVFIGKNSL